MKNLRIPLIAGLLTLSCVAQASRSPIAQADCQADYLDLMSKPVINVTMAYGYFDSEGTTLDQIGADFFLTQMTAPCKSWDVKTCGFKRSGTHPIILTRMLTGPDGMMKTVNIRVDNPSLSTSDAVNRTNPLQAKRSEEVKNFYLKGLRDSEITIYMGHSRNGGGPDFDPPILKSNGHTNYDFYNAHPKDKNEVLKVLQETPDKPRLIGFFSCSSIRWFSKGVSNSAPATGFLGTDESFTVSNFNQVLPFLEKIFSYQCIDKLVVPDEVNLANAKIKKKWSVPEKSKQLSQDELTRATLETLTNQLYSRSPKIRYEAYRELTSFDKKYFSARTWEVYNSYKTGTLYLK